MKYTKILLAAALILAAAFTAEARKKAPTEVTISKEVLQDKIRGGWAGQIIGCTYGGPTEFGYATTINRKIDIPWNEHIIKGWYDKTPGLYDDVYMDLTFVEVFEKEGLDAPAESFAKAFAYAGYNLWHANLQARYNIMHGIMPPASGYWENNAHADDIDFQIEADYAGIMSPGMPNAASHYCEKIGHMMNYGDGYYGGVYVAAMYAYAFISDDPEYVATQALKVIPAESNYYKCMADVIKWHSQYPEDWNICWALANENYGFDKGCPDGVFKSFNIDAVINSAYILIGLLYGDKDFYRTIDIATRCGCDSDCNPASAGGILATMIGYNAIPEYWKKPLLDVVDRPLAYTDISYNEACRLSMKHAMKVIEQYGGKVGENDVTIKLQTPEAVPFEECFTGHEPVARKAINKYVDKLGEYTFTGKGIVFKSNYQKPKDYVQCGYEAEIECYVDGKYDKTVKIPTKWYYDTKELYMKFNLPVGEHKVSFKWVNKPENLEIILTDAIIYSDKLVHTEHE